MGFLSSLCPSSWFHLLEAEFSKEYFLQLEKFLEQEMAVTAIYPERTAIFRALELVRPDEVRVVILGQDPYHGGQADGLAFSVAAGTLLPPSLKNIFKEIAADVGCSKIKNGDLTPWAKQGVLLLNNVLTVRAHQANSHQKIGWEQFTTAIIRALAQRQRPLVFILWGNYAQKKASFIDSAYHTVITAAHPSPLSARLWFGNRSFSRTNQALERYGEKAISW